MTRLNPIACLNCGKENDGHTNPEDESAVPTTDDLSVCLYCGDVSAYVVSDDDVFSLRELTPQEEESLMGNEYLRRIIYARRAVMERDR